jgi:hypothetical protein
MHSQPLGSAKLLVPPNERPWILILIEREDRFEQDAPAPMNSFRIDRALPLNGRSASRRRLYTWIPT